MTMADDTLVKALASKERSLRGEREHSSGRMFTAILFSIFIIALLFVIYAGTSIYRSLVSMQSAADDSRLALSLVANNVRAADATDAIASGTGPEGRSLVLVEHLDSGTYETRIYLYQGSIVEEYALSGAAYTPAKATRIVRSSTFDYSFKDGLLTITTEQGTVDVALRNLQAGE